MKKAKILFANLGYCTDMDGSLVQLFRYGYRYLFCPKKVEKYVLSHLKNLIRKEKPDICCLIEIDPPQLEGLIGRAYPYGDSSNKYGLKSRLRRSRLFRNKANGFLSKKKLVFRTHFFKYGIKKLVYEIKLNDTSLFIVHLSLSPHARKKQLKELKELTRGKRAIIAGDFNIFSGVRELTSLLENLKLINRRTDLTFPAYHPRKSLDLFLCSKEVQIKSLRILDQHFSDHLPVVLEVLT